MSCHLWWCRAAHDRFTKLVETASSRRVYNVADIPSIVKSTTRTEWDTNWAANTPGCAEHKLPPPWLANPLEPFVGSAEDGQGGGASKDYSDKDAVACAR
jgi:hypothetical protein